MAPAAVLVKQVLRGRLATEALVGCHVRQVVRIASLMIIVRASIVDALVISIVIVHHGIVQRLLLMARILVDGALAFLECRALTHEQLTLTRHLTLREVAHLRITSVRGLLATEYARVLFAGLATRARSRSTVRAQRCSSILICKVQLLFIDHAEGLDVLVRAEDLVPI